MKPGPIQWFLTGKETMDYLRNTLGFEGIIVSDWGDQGDNNSQGVTVDGIDLMSLSIPERYAFIGSYRLMKVDPISDT